MLNLLLPPESPQSLYGGDGPEEEDDFESVERQVDRADEEKEDPK
jgi:hypothetical protein